VIHTTQAALVAALAAARGLTLRTLEAQLGARPGALSKALSRGTLPRAGAVTSAGAAAVVTADAVAAALGVDVAVLLGAAPVLLALADGPPALPQGRDGGAGGRADKEAARAAGLDILTWYRESGWTQADAPGGVQILVRESPPDPDLDAPLFGRFDITTPWSRRNGRSGPEAELSRAEQLAESAVAEAWAALVAYRRLRAMLPGPAKP
jgi:hypothetical protein